jgi:putative resolvase
VFKWKFKMSKMYHSTKEVCSILGVCKKTLHNWAEEGKIDFIRTDGGWRKYNLDKYLKDNNLHKKVKVCYCRVSSYDQKEDLVRQVTYLTEKYPEHELIKDIGSGINFKRKGLLKLIDLVVENKLDEIVVTYKDRLCRIGFELLEHIFKTYSNTTIIIENLEFKPPEQEITEDLIEITTVYSSKLYGSRSYKK